jgi:large subunit ribosomal protein L30
MADTLKLRQVKSPNGASRKQRESLRTLGLGRIGKASERPDDAVVRGQLSKVGHLVKVERDG